MTKPTPVAPLLRISSDEDLDDEDMANIAYDVLDTAKAQEALISELVKALARLELHTHILPEDMDAAGSVMAQTRAALTRAKELGYE